jgi:phosphopantothenoylcysteine decarboxylase / phosphopantothenate---cysteine ligase
MGIALAQVAADYGAWVDLVLGPVEIVPLNTSIRITNVTTAESMTKETISRFPDCDIAILAAAVSDYTPESAAGKKLKRSDGEIILKLKQTTDIAESLGKLKKSTQILVGFALETNDEIQNAIAKLKKKNLDIIVLNSLRDKGAGFGHNTNRITIIDSNNNIDKFELKSKDEAARDILDKISSILNERSL